MENKIVVIIPSLNESENLLVLLKHIRQVAPNSTVIIVDDSLPKEFQKLSKLLKTNPRNLILISRGEKLGRGSAVIAGFKEALKNDKCKYFFEMDADLAHDPAEFKLFLEKADKADLVVGSRYLAKSRITKWPLYRLVQSRVINWLLNYWLGLSLSDYTDGFRMYSRRAVEFLMKANLKEKGYIALSESAYKLKKGGFVVLEVPISFRDRQMGKSNADFKELMRSLIGAVRIRLRKD